MEKVLSVLALVVLLLAIGGCDEDERLARFAEKSVDQQAQQNKNVTTQQQHIAQATHALIEADARSRTDFAKLVGDLNAERRGLNRERDALEDERRNVAAQRRTVPLITSVLDGLALILVCLLPLIVALYVLRAVTQDGQDDGTLNDLLVCELLLVPGPPATTSLLNAPDE